MILQRFSILLLVTVVIVSCFAGQEDEQAAAPTANNVVPFPVKTTIPQRNFPDYESMMIRAGLEDIHRYDSSIKVQLAYATENNFMKENIYGNLNKAYLLPFVCKRLAKAQQLLKQKNKNYSLIVYDAARPHACQQLLWDKAPLTAREKHLYISSPEKTSLHNYGAAVDVAIVDQNNLQLDFGTTYDFFGPEAQPQKEDILLKLGKLTASQIANRQLLRTVMRSAGFSSIKTEWWHFNATSRKNAKVKFKLVE